MNQPKNPFAAINQALQKPDIGKAKELFDGLAADMLMTWQASVLAAMIALAEKDYRCAKEHIEAACTRGVAEEISLALWASFYQGLNDVPAERNAREKLAVANSTLPNLKALASFYRRVNDAEGATSIALQALLQDNGCEWAHILRYNAQANEGSGLFEVLVQAISDCAVFPAFPNLRNALQVLSIEQRHSLYGDFTGKWPDELTVRLELAIAAGLVDDIFLIILSLYSSHTELIQGIAQILSRQLFTGAVKDAVKLARKAVAAWPTSGQAHHILYSVLAKVAGPKELVQAIREAVVNASDYPKFYDIRLTLFGLPPGEAAELKAQIISRWPEAASSLEAPQIDHSKAIKLTLAGQRTEALQYLAEQGDAGHDPNLEDACALVKALPDPDGLRRPIVIDTGEELVVSPPSTNGVTVLFFTGLNDRVGMDYETIDAFCAASGAASICLRDESKMIFLMGIGSIGHDRASTIAVLRKKIEEIGTRQLIVFGSSGGTYSAVTYGVELGATRIICLGAQTSIHHFLEAGGDPRARMMIERIKDQFDPSLLDLRRLWQTLPHPPHLDLYYGELHQNDAKHAHHLDKLENVALHPLVGVKSHNVILFMVRMGMLPKIFEIGAVNP